MADPQLFACRYFLIRVAPDPVRHEFINIGVGLFQPEGGFSDLKIISDDRRLRCLFPDFRLDSDLPGFENHLRELIRHDPGAWLEMAEDKFSHGLTVSGAKTVLTADPAAELATLFRQYAEPPVASSSEERALKPRRQILHTMHSAFEQSGILSHLSTQVRARQLAGGRDNFRFDYYYKPNGAHYLLQAVSTESPEQEVKTLCFTVERLRRLLSSRQEHLYIDAVHDAPTPASPGHDLESAPPGPEFMRSRVLEKATPSAAGRPGPDAAGDDLDSAWSEHAELLQSSEIRLVPLASLPQLTQRIRYELHLG